MPTFKIGRTLRRGGLVLGVMGAFACRGCSSAPQNPDKPPAAATAESAKGNSQLWSENCGRCHNVRDPSTYSRAQWQVAMHHMRVRGSLTAEEHRRILEFLEAAD
jgi:hypothetical protein